jgi:pyruvate-formate lyase-activating enzyme
MKCGICETECQIQDNGTGKCGMYSNKNGVISERFPNNYLVIVPSEIESVCLTHYYPKAKFLQICTIGCNFRCNGCVSWVLTENIDGINGALINMPPEKIIQKALDEGCKGIAFCFNEPAVSFFTFKKISSLARKNNLLVGCATNGYFTDESFRDLLDHIDFINIGVKGCTDETYKKFGAKAASPILRNLETSCKSSVFTEVATVHVKGRENELKELAGRVAAISKDIPFQVMRFIPLAGADSEDEPSIKESEILCEELKKIMNYVYLFNSPGTDFLNTYCPECGKIIVRRGFNGPMCSHVAEYKKDGICDCGFKMPIKGKFEGETDVQILGYYGGYKSISGLESTQTTLGFLKERDTHVISHVLQELLKSNYFKDIYEKTKRIDSYLDTIDHYARLAGRTKEAGELRSFIEKYISIIENNMKNTERPAVYFSLGNPLLALFADKFECNLVELAGGNSVNKYIDRDDRPGLTIKKDVFNSLNPDIILIVGSVGFPLGDFYNYCDNNGLNVKALENKRVYPMYPYRAAGTPDWILGLLHIANTIHPEIFNFDVDAIAEEFYKFFLGVNYSSIKKHNRSILHSSMFKQKQESNPMLNGIRNSC